MRAIHKFDLSDHVGEYEVEMPRNADILCVQMQDGRAKGSVYKVNAPRIWAIVDDSQPKELRRIVVVGTGWDLPADIGRGEYIGTYQTDGGFVWHVFATKPNVLGDGR
jgi:hypothetical protein